MLPDMCQLFGLLNRSATDLNLQGEMASMKERYFALP